MAAALITILSILLASAWAIINHAAWWKGILMFVAAFVSLNILFIAFFAIVSLFTDDTKPIRKQRPICRFGCAEIASLICSYVGVKVHVSGEEKLPPNSGFLLVSNHVSMFDPISVAAALRKHNISFVSKPENMKIPIAGKLSYGAGYLPINRENNREALKTILTAAQYLKDGICSVAIYPEGTRSKDGNMLPFHSGSFKICQKADAPLVIMATIGTEKVTQRLFRRNDVYLEILETVPAEICKKMKTSELSKHARNLIGQAIEGFAGQ